MSLSSAQQECVHERGHLLVVAGPGSGKTTTMVKKIEHLLAQSPTHKIIAVTFTRESASELRHRICKALNTTTLDRVAVGTFHSLTLAHIKKSRDVQVLAPARQHAMLLDALRIHNMGAEEIQTALAQFDQAKCSLVREPSIEGLAWFRHYQSRVDKLGMVDLYDLMRDTTTAMLEGSLQPIAGTHLIIDETQDSDEVQFAWARAHARRGIVTTMVGDDDQTIYAWRRAQGYLGMKSFADEFKARIVTLGENYRSREQIVEASARLIAHNDPHRLPKNFIPRAGPGGEIQVLWTFANVRSGCEAAVERVWDDASPGRPTRSGEETFIVNTKSWGILARNNGFLHIVEAELRNRRIKYYRAKGTIWEDPIAAQFFAVLETVVGDKAEGLDVILHRYPVPHELVLDIISSKRWPIKSLLDGLVSKKEIGAGATALEAPLARIRAWREMYRRNEISALISRVEDFLIEPLVDADSDAATISIAAAVAKDLSKMKGPLLGRINTLRHLAPPADMEGAVCLHTMHGAKGLEFENVIIVGATANALKDDSEDRGGERRLFYVAATRAKQKLFIYTVTSQRSRFIAELTGSGPSHKILPH
jgi:DNA helicase-2/ATP-dependent DNA helicase PcrA